MDKKELFEYMKFKFDNTLQEVLGSANVTDITCTCHNCVEYLHKLKLRDEIRERLKNKFEKIEEKF